MTKDDEKAEVLIASFFNSETSCSLDTQTPELKEQGGEHSYTSIIQEKLLVTCYIT